MLITLEETKEYLRIDGADEDSTLQLIINAAIEFMQNTGAKFDDTNPLAKAICLLIVGDLYENRTFTADKVGQKISPVVSMLLTQLCLGGDTT